MNRGSNERYAATEDGLKASMRPRFMNRGSHDLAVLRPECHIASMRPRFMNRGSEARAQVDRYRPKRASMRPRFMNRGSKPSKRRASSSPDGFNEAPIHESGK